MGSAAAMSAVGIMNKITVKNLASQKIIESQGNYHTP